MPQFENESTYKKFLEDGRESEFDNLFDNAVEKTKASVLGKRHPLYIGGKEVHASEEYAEYSPIDGTLIGRFSKASRENARAAVDAAAAAFPAWSAMKWKDRVAIMRKAAGIYHREKFNVAAILSMENGKTRYESVGEVDEAIDFLNYYALEIERNKGFVRRADLKASSATVKAGFQGAPGAQEKVTLAMKPYGVFGVIAPFNFPVSISTGMSSAALVTGNTVVFKPSSTDSMALLTGLKLYEIYAEAGVPAGAFNYLPGPGSEVGDELVISRKVQGIAFTGSKATGFAMMSKSYGMGIEKVYIVEMGGKNATIVSKYADLDQAVTGVASSAYGFAGQKCSATSRVYVHESLKEQFISKLADKIRSFKLGDPLKKEVYVGPLISQKALQKYRDAVDEAKRVGRVIVGGNTVETGMKGIYVEPTLAEAEHGSRLFKEEFFVPFLAIDTYKKFSEAVDKANDVEYGLCAGLYSKKSGEIKEFIARVQAGVMYINRETGATTGAIVGHHTFVGWKASGTSGKGTGSRFYLQQFLREQSEAIAR